MEQQPGEPQTTSQMKSPFCMMPDIPGLEPFVPPDPSHSLNEEKDQPCEVLPGLFLSGCQVEQDLALLERHNITHVLQVAWDVSPSHPHKLKYLHKPLSDIESQDLVTFFPDCFQFIDSGRQQGAVLVHCIAGVSRSAAMVMGYVMWKQQLPYKEARSLVRAARAVAWPNEGFVMQLRRFQEAGWMWEGWSGWGRQKYEELEKKQQESRTMPDWFYWDE